jgi:hypothetical protein
MIFKRRLHALAATLLFAASAFAQIPAFPGAEGFGAHATGGRGGDVYTVTNLNSSGVGSLNYGVETAPSAGRTIVFAVSGYIPIANNSQTGNKTIRLVQNKITIAGQTAPGDGIGLKDGRVLMTGNNGVLRHIRIRHGRNGSAGDCLNLDSSASNSIIDHVSLMFSTDENISFFSSTLDNFTMQYSTSAWGMERHNAGGLWDLVDGSCHHSLWAHHRTRNPKARPYGLLEWINNVTFHWRTEGFIMGDSQSNVSWKANVRGNYFLTIPDHQFGVDNTALSKARVGDNGQPNFALFLDNCLHDSNNNGLLDGTDKGYSIVSGQPFPNAGTTPGTVSYAQSATPFPGSSGTATVNIDPPLTAYKKVLSNSGPLRLDAAFTGPLRDELDSLLMTSVENQQSILVAKDTPLDANDTPSNGEARLAQAPYNITNGGFGTLNSTAAPADTDGDGMPDYWESALGWTAGTQDHNAALSSSGGILSGTTFMPANTPAGYTRLEEYLHFKAIPHAAINPNRSVAPSSLSVDLRRYVRGFVKAPVTFTFSAVTNGAVVLQPDGYTAVFTPTLDFSGRARFDFTVTDGDGSTWKQTLGVLVKSAPPTLPPAPAGLTLVTAGNSQLLLSWSAVSGATGYRLKRATTSGGPYTLVASPTGTSYTHTGLTNGTTYYYVVAAANEAGEGANSSQLAATPRVDGPATIQAESGTITNGTFDSNNAGFNGTAFANLALNLGSLQFTGLHGGSGGPATLAIRFALGATASRTGNLVVNGVSQSITFPITGAWTTWNTLTLTIPLSAGATNTLRFESTSADLANLDEFTLTPTALPTVTISATDASAGEFGADKQLIFTVARSGATTSALSVPLTASGTATPAVDYSGFASSLSLPTGQASAALPLTVLADTVAEGTETVTVSLGASSSFLAGSPSSASATIADAPEQAFYFTAISDPAKRAPTDDADGDSLLNKIEYFLGTNPVSPGVGGLTITTSAAGSFKVRYSRAKNRPDVSGSLRWSTDLVTWFTSGQSDGARTVTFVPAVISEAGVDPETVEEAIVITGGAISAKLFVRLAVE